MAKNIILIIMLCVAIAWVIRNADSMPAAPAEYRLVCDTETKRAYVTYKHWSAHIPNADKFCDNIGPKIKPTYMVM